MTHSRPGRTVEAHALRVENGNARETAELIATEEPLEMRLNAGSQSRRLGVTMRTPGNDLELAAGYVFSEGIVRSREELDEITYCLDDDITEEQQYNVVSIRLRSSAMPEIGGLERRVVTSSACGVCGRENIEALLERCAPVLSDLTVDAAFVGALPDRMRGAQRIFEATGGLHAAAIFDRDANVRVVREDVGRHNALDKAVGWGLMQGVLPFQDCVAMVSGRASFELVQKCAAAGIPVLCAVSAPSSLAVQTADALGITLIGFVREGRSTVYSHRERFHILLP
ncbi:MAG: formate dehydrogenase accessory sulfurtransferase FdhD [Candidatus Eremiobacteraeota bacterium]|nr:formate dehydrogenase accessory sulfurtransferase FdhD [Candidatus Eremiobacteraeota bacterium]